MRLSAKEAAKRAAKMKQDWEDEKYPSYSALSRAYGVSVVYARNCIIGAKCSRIAPPKGRHKPLSMLGLDYLVYADGRIWSIATNKVMATGTGSIKFTNQLEGRTFKTSVARLVLTLFVRRPKTGEVARHLDDDRRNNNVANLTWGYNQDNMDDKVRNGNQPRGEAMHTAKMDAAEVIAFVNGYDGSVTKKAYCEAYADEMGKDQSPRYLFNVLQKTYWKHLWDDQKVVDPKIVKYIRKKAKETELPAKKFYRRCAEFLIDKGYQVNAATVEKIVLRKTWDSV